MVRLSLCMGAVVAATTVYACSSTPAPGGSGDGGAADVSADAPSDAPSDSGVVVAADAGKGIIVKVNGVQEELRAGAAATTLSTGWGIQASDGKTSNHGLVIILRMLGGNGQVLTGPLAVDRTISQTECEKHVTRWRLIMFISVSTAPDPSSH